MQELSRFDREEVARKLQEKDAESLAKIQAILDGKDSQEGFDNIHENRAHRLKKELNIKWAEPRGGIRIIGSRDPILDSPWTATLSMVSGLLRAELKAREAPTAEAPTAKLEAISESGSAAAPTLTAQPESRSTPPASTKQPHKKKRQRLPKGPLGLPLRLDEEPLPLKLPEPEKKD